MLELAELPLAIDDETAAKKIFFSRLVCSKGSRTEEFTLVEIQPKSLTLWLDKVRHFWWFF